VGARARSASGAAAARIAAAMSDLRMVARIMTDGSEEILGARRRV
jgi:hypothetical protein